MPKLNDTQMILLSAASQHDAGSLYPLPVALAGTGERTTNAIATLLKHGLAAEQETEHAGCVRRVDGDIGYGMFITNAGMKALGLDNAESFEAAPADVAPSPDRQTKSAMVIALLEREDGATMSELIAATSWLPHTTRAALTGLRKKGHVVERSKRADGTCYRITA
jgi:hypothetical protein